MNLDKDLAARQEARTLCIQAEQAAQQLRYSLTATRSLNSSEMHHNPDAPTSV